MHQNVKLPKSSKLLSLVGRPVNSQVFITVVFPSIVLHSIDPIMDHNKGKMSQNPKRNAGLHFVNDTVLSPNENGLLIWKVKSPQAKDSN
jgi:hypothetical protein